MKYLFQCSNIHFIVDIADYDAINRLSFLLSFVFNLENKCINDATTKKLIIIDCGEPEGSWNLLKFPNTNLPFLILNDKEAENIYIHNIGSKYLTFSPVSLSFFQVQNETRFYFIKNAFQPAYFRNTILRFFINHLVLASGLFFHASGGIINNKSYLMTGFSDIGKSTALELMNNDEILSDDMIGCQQLDGIPHFYSTPFGRVVTKNIHAEAKAVFFLVKSDKFRIEKLNKTQAVARYMTVHQRYILSLFGDIRVKAFQSARKYFRIIPAYELYFPEDYIDQDAISKILDGDESDVGDTPMSEIEWQIVTMTKKKPSEVDKLEIK